MQKKNLEKIYRVNGDILSTLIASDEIGWGSVSELSIQRIIYISTVLFSFRYEDKKNPFEEDYDYSVSLRGPYSDIIPQSLNFLIVNDWVILSSEGCELSERNMPDMSRLPNYLERKEWIETIIYILGIYGEEKIYDFVFRDPQYQDNLQRNSIREINTTSHNKTVQTLRKMKIAFEKALGESASELDNKKYLNMYFDYVFSRILRGETD